MKITLFGATGQLGSECLQQAVAAGHELMILVRSAKKISAELRSKVCVVEGDALCPEDVWRVIAVDTDAVLFAIGVDKHSPPDLCTDVTRIILDALRGDCGARFIWCGGGSTFVEQDVIGFGAKFVRKFAETFMSLRHIDKEHQYLLLKSNPDIPHIGVRPLQMTQGPMRGDYRLGFDRFNGFSRISFADCAHAMLAMLESDRWLHRAPIVQY